MIDNSQHFLLINEAFPHIGKQLEEVWGSADFLAVIDSLQQDKRDPHRAGFPPDVLFAIQNLEAEHAAAYPAHARKSSIWGFVD
jgi:hypothetical protein